MKVRLVLVGAALALAAALTGGTATAAPASQAASAKTCYAGYTLATFSWGQRCIRAGQFCKKARNPEYHKYKFQCVNGELRKQKGKGKPK
jgi:hypothetical protein